MRKILYSVVTLCILSIALSWKAVPRLSNKSESEIITPTVEPIIKSTPSPLEFIDGQIKDVFDDSNLESTGLAFDVFRKAYIGFVNLQMAGKVLPSASVLSVADFSVSSKKKRLWIVDLDKKDLLLNTWVSHGRGSGGEMATKFSNTMSSHQSSLGFYITGEVYHGKHGRSLRLDGMDAGFNSKARERAIVVHGADYVSARTIKNLNRLGLSHGCPAVPAELSDKIIDLIKEKTVLYVHADLPTYTSDFLNEDKAGKALLASFLEKNETPSHQVL